VKGGEDMKTDDDVLYEGNSMVEETYCGDEDTNAENEEKPEEGETYD